MEETGGFGMVNSNPAYETEIESELNAGVDESLLKWFSISLSDVILRGKRLEASVFNVEAKQARERVSKGKYGAIMLGGDNGIIKNSYYPGRFKRIYCERGNGEPFFLPSQMSEVYPKAEKYISTLTKCDLEELRLKPGTLLLTRSGTIGTLSCVSRTTQGKVYSDDVIRVTFKNDCDLGFVYTFLKSKTGNKILTTNGYGAVITHLEPEHLASVPVPNAPVELRQRINDLIAHSFELRDESNELTDRAAALLIGELQLPDISAFNVGFYKKNAPVETFIQKLSDIDGRIDASYHNPIVDAITKHLQKYAEEVTFIGDARISEKIILPSRFKRIYVDEGYGVPFFGGRSIGELDPVDKKYLSFSQHNKKISEELTIKENMILVTCSGTIGNIALVPKHWDNWAMTHDIIRLVTNKDMTGYVYIWLQSVYASKLIKAFSYGSVVTHIEKEHFANVPVPLLKNHGVQHQINTLALEANQKRYEAYQLEQEALRIMDTEVIYAK